MEIEIDRFGMTREQTLKKYEMMSPPEPNMSDTLPLAVDAIATLNIGEGRGPGYRN